MTYLCDVPGLARSYHVKEHFFRPISRAMVLFYNELQISIRLNAHGVFLLSLLSLLAQHTSSSQYNSTAAALQNYAR